MLCTDSMPRTHHAALEQAKSGLDGVGVNVAHNIRLLTVIDDLVPRDSRLLHSDRMRSEIVGHNHVNIFADVLADKLGERTGFGISGMEHPKIAVALTDADNDFFVLVFADVTFAAIPSANIGFVKFYGAAKFRFRGGRHSSANPVAQVPRCFVTTDSESPLDLASRHSLFRFAHQHDRSEPSHKWKMGIIENTASGHAELEVAGFAVEENLFGFQLNDRLAATCATRPIRPAQTGEKLAALVISRKCFVHVN